MNRFLTYLMVVGLLIATATAVFAAAVNDTWNGQSGFYSGAIGTVNSTGPGQRTFFIPATTGVSGTLKLSDIDFQCVHAEPNSSAVVYDVQKCSVPGDKDDAGAADCSTVYTGWDSDGGCFGFVGYYLRLNITTADANAEIVHMGGSY